MVKFCICGLVGWVGAKTRDCLPALAKFSDAALSTISIERNAFHGDWNYRIRSD
jgi:hypothetical protein